MTTQADKYELCGTASVTHYADRLSMTERRGLLDNEALNAFNGRARQAAPIDKGTVARTHTDTVSDRAAPRRRTLVITRTRSSERTHYPFYRTARSLSKHLGSTCDNCQTRRSGSDHCGNLASRGVHWTQRSTCR